jgi:hypothetical protein
VKSGEAYFVSNLGGVGTSFFNQVQVQRAAVNTTMVAPRTLSQSNSDFFVHMTEYGPVFVSPSGQSPAAPASRTWEITRNFFTFFGGLPPGRDPVGVFMPSDNLYLVTNLRRNSTATQALFGFLLDTRNMKASILQFRRAVTSLCSYYSSTGESVTIFGDARARVGVILSSSDNRDYSVVSPSLDPGSFFGFTDSDLLNPPFPVQASVLTGSVHGNGLAVTAISVRPVVDVRNLSSPAYMRFYVIPKSRVDSFDIDDYDYLYYTDGVFPIDAPRLSFSPWRSESPQFLISWIVSGANTVVSLKRCLYELYSHRT